MVTSSLARLRFVAAAALLSAAAPLHASTPRFFQAATQTDFLKGDVDNLSIDGRGRLVLGPATEIIYETPSPFLWTLTPGPDGSVFMGTGNDGRVYRVDSQGRSLLFFDAPELEVHAMTPAPGGGLYVGTSPDGRIYKVDRDGKSSVFFDPEEKYIWALATDAKGNLYAGTGERGIVYKITSDGTGAPFYQTKATHATSLIVDREGQVLVGTESPGRVFRVNDQGRGFLLLDTPFQEIRTLRFDENGMLYAAAVNGRPSSGLAPSVPTDPGSTSGTSTDLSRAPVPSVSVTTEITAIAVPDATPGGSGTTRVEARTSKGGVYRIAPDGLWDLLWESRDDSPYDLAFDSAHRLIVGTGPKGKILRLEGEPLRPLLLARAPAQQVTALYTDARGRLYYATANPGKLFRLAANRATRGSYESEVQDAQMVASWGSLRWRGTALQGSRIEVSTRTGNTEAPDDTWSPWSSSYTDASGSAVTSPKARYLQWRAVLSGSGEGPALTSVNIAYLQRNLRPQVRSITVHPPGIVFQKPFSNGDPDLAGFDNQNTPDRRLAQAAQNPSTVGPSLGRRTYEKGLQTLIWRADDENDDELLFDVWYRREGEATWKVLRRDLTDSILVWDTATVPNGTYFVKVVASDGRSNPGATALSGDLESASFEIDNTPPAIGIGTVRVQSGRTTILFDVNDDHSPVLRVEYSSDGQIWHAVFPVDGLADSQTEHYELTLEGLLGERGVTVRAADAMNNVSTAQVDAPRAAGR